MSYPPGPPGPPGEPPYIDGEVVGDDGQPEPDPPGIPWQDIGNSLELLREDERRKRRSGAHKFTEEDMEHAIHLVAIGFTCTEVAAEMTKRGRFIKAQTISNWYKGRVAERLPHVIDIAATQARMVVQLEGMQQEAMRVARMYPGSDLAVRGIAQARNILATRAALLGVEQPKREIEPDNGLAHDPELLKLVEEARLEAQAETAKIREQFERGTQ